MSQARGPHVPPFGPSAAEDDAASVKDNAMRSVSMRINTSDFGRIKVIARRLHARESDVFRVLIKIGLAGLAPLCDAAARGPALLALWSAHGATLTSHLHLDAVAIDRLLNGEPAPGRPAIAPEDVALLAMLNAPPRYLALRLKDLTGRDHPPDRIGLEIAEYLRDKYAR